MSDEAIDYGDVGASGDDGGEDIGSLADFIKSSEGASEESEVEAIEEEVESLSDEVEEESEEASEEEPDADSKRQQSFSRMQRNLSRSAKELQEARAQIRALEQQVQQRQQVVEEYDDPIEDIQNRMARKLGVNPTDSKVKEALRQLAIDMTAEVFDEADSDGHLKSIKEKRAAERKIAERERALTKRLDEIDGRRLQAEQAAIKSQTESMVQQFITSNAASTPNVLAAQEAGLVNPVEEIWAAAEAGITSGEFPTPRDAKEAHKILKVVADRLEQYFENAAKKLSSRINNSNKQTTTPNRSNKQTQTKQRVTTGTGGGGRGRATSNAVTRSSDDDDDSFASWVRKQRK